MVMNTAYYKIQRRYPRPMPARLYCKACGLSVWRYASRCPPGGHLCHNYINDDDEIASDCRTPWRSAPADSLQLIIMLDWAYL